MYSQNDEERVIAEYFRREPPQHRAFLDIGAFDGRTFSNTLALTEQGWHGVLVEASPQAFKALELEYKNRQGHKLVMAMLGANWVLRPFWDTPDAVATDDPAHREKWREWGQYQEVVLPEVPLGALLHTFPGPYDFINIDVEGEPTRQIFKAIPYQQLGCRLVCVEYDGDGSDWLSHAHAVGLREIHRNGENLILEATWAR